MGEPVAAALAYAHTGQSVGNYPLVYDLGGGTFDLAVLAREDEGFHVALEPKGIARYGGDDFDRALYDYCDEIAQQRLGRSISLTSTIDLEFVRLCKRRKENLSLHPQATFSSLLPSQNGAVQFKHRVDLDRGTFESLIEERAKHKSEEREQDTT